MGAERVVLLTLPWIVDRGPAVDDADVSGRVLVADPMNNRVRAVRLYCVSHFPGWFPLAGINPEVVGFTKPNRITLED